MLVAVTGNIASGKSSVAALFAANGAFVIDADGLAREAVAGGTPALADIGRRWPATIRADGSLDRAALRRIVFADNNARLALNAIVHPEVARRRNALIAQAHEHGVQIIVYDVPLLFESGIDGSADTIVVVDAPDDVRRARLMHTRGLSAAEADAMMAAQMPAAEKRARADYVIENGGDREHLAAQAHTVWRALARVVPRG